MKFNYGSLARMNFKKRYNLRGLVEDHHIIPKQFRNHKNIKKLEFNVSCTNNIMMMPTIYGKSILDTNRKIHSGGHQFYNKFVGQKLDRINTREELDALILYLRNNLRKENSDIPWK